MSVVSVLFRIPNHNTGPQTPKHVRYICIYAHLSGWWSGRKAQWPKQLNLYCHGLLARGHSEIADQHLLLRMESIKAPWSLIFLIFLFLSIFKKKRTSDIQEEDSHHRERLLRAVKELKAFTLVCQALVSHRWWGSNLYYIRNCLGNMSPRKLIWGSSKTCLLLHVC